MGSGSAVRLELGVEIERRVLAKKGTREDIALVYDERPELFDGFADQIIETANVIRGDRDSFRLTDPEVMIQIPALPRPTPDYLKKKYGVKEVIHDFSTTEATTLRLATVLKSTEGGGINGETYERRLVPLRGRTLGYQHWEWFLKNQDNAEAIPDPKVRAALKALIGKVYINFSGILVLYESGYRYVPYAYDDGERWVGYWDWADGGFSGRGRVAVSSK